MIVERTHKIEENSIRDYLRVIFRHKILFIVVPIAILLPVYTSLQFKTQRYSASVKMFVKAAKHTEADYYQGMMPMNLVQDHAELVKSNIVLARTVEALKLYEIPSDYEKNFASPLKAALIKSRMRGRQDLRDGLTTEEKKKKFFNSAIARLSGQISIEPLKATSFFNITASDFSPTMAILIANSVSRSYVVFDLEQQIQELKLKYGDKHSSVIQIENHIQDVLKTLHGKHIPPLEAIGPASIKIVSQAESIMKIQGINKPILIMMAFFASIFISILLAFALDFYDQTIKSPNDIVTLLQIPYLCSIPKRKPRGGPLASDMHHPPTPYIKSLLNLSEQLWLLIKQSELKTLVIADGEASNDAAEIAANIGRTLADDKDLKVLIIDANLRTPTVSSMLDVENGAGLVDVLTGKTDLSHAVRSIGRDAGLNVLTSGNGTSKSTWMLDSSGMTQLIVKAKSEYDVILITSSSIQDYSDTCILASYADGVAIVINEGEVRKHVLTSSISALRQKKVNIIGAILNKRKYVIPGIIYRLT